MRLLHPAGTTLADATTSTTEQQAARKAAFDEVAAALKSLGVSDEEAHEAWSLLGAILALGELEFEDEVFEEQGYVMGVYSAWLENSRRSRQERGRL